MASSRKPAPKQLKLKVPTITAGTRVVEPKATEVDAYIFIKENLRTLNWDTRNPQKVAGGQVYTQNECLSNIEIKRLLGLEDLKTLSR